MPNARKSDVAFSEPWLETIGGGAPILLIAPHGGHAGNATRALLNPKVNDLYTADITRELAARLSGCALINAGMDRNHLDLNRLSQVTANAPWFLDAIHRHLGEIVARHGHATVLLVHGWNVIQARVDLGLGLRRHGDELRPPGAARISASDEFIHGRLDHLAERLRAHGILASFGLRYPGGGAQNLLQAFTDRHLDSPVGALRDLSLIASRGEVDAVQLELSVAVRMPGELRKRCLDAVAEVFGARSRAARDSKLSVIRSPVPKPPAPAKKVATVAAPPSRVGIELFDPAAGIGAMASFDLGPGSFGARIMILLPGGGVALFTGEGKTKLDRNRVSLGPLALESDRGDLILTFRGHAVIVPDATHYLSIERALASGWLDESMEVAIRMHPSGETFDLPDLFAPREGVQRDSSLASFGTLSGAVRIDTTATEISGFGRSGLSFTGIGPQRFISRRMMWACFGGGGAPTALELRAISADDGEHRSGRMLRPSGWTQCEVARVEVETPSVLAPPVRLSASFTANGGDSALVGKVANFIPLSRPGPDNTRIFTALGFATFKLGAQQGAGMFECSRRADEIPGSGGGEDEGED